MTHGNRLRRVKRALVSSLVAGLFCAGPGGIATARAVDTAAAARLIVRPRVGVIASKQQRLLAREGARLQRRLTRLGAEVVEVPRSKVERIAARLRQSGAFAVVEEDKVARVAGTPNDPMFSWEWGLVRINTVESWGVTLGSPTVPVAVVDSGVDASHPDLQGQLLPGYDFVNDDDDPNDDNGHGTAMAGIIVASADNAVGVAGVAPDSRVIPVKVLGPDGTGYYSTLAEGIMYATDHGARVISLSLTGPSPSTTLQNAVDYARAHGAVVVAAAGNSGDATPAYPADYDGVVAVAASDANDQRAWFSSYGSSIALAAPGVGVMTTQMGGGYGGSTGTSPATAMTSGAFALLLAANLGLSPAEAVSRMTDNALDLGTKGWDPYFGFGRLDAYAALLPGQVVRHLPDRTLPVVKLASPAPNSLVYGLVPIDVSATDDVGVTEVDLIVDQQLREKATVPPFSFAWDTSGMASGRHTVQLVACDASGNCAATHRAAVLVTPGVGLLVKHAAVKYGRMPGTDAVSINALLALPDGQTLDPDRDTITIELDDADGALFVTTVPAASMTLTRRGVMRSSTVSTSPADGDVAVRIAHWRAGNSYVLGLKSRALSLGPAGTAMTLRVTVGSALLSQPLSFRAVRRRMVAP